MDFFVYNDSDIAGQVEQNRSGRQGSTGLGTSWHADL